ncbi:MAG: hypothetical protein J0M12_13095, partial [Deltaproteobacteria bacterium]|nr:hypothetical protein [Deltaproteobacteria bacterium]
SLQSLGDGGSGGVGGMAFSTGGAGAIGTDFDWYRNNSMGWGPATFDSLGAPQDYGAFRVTATVPSPGALALMLSATSFTFGMRRRRI